MSSPEDIPQEAAPIDPEWVETQIANLKKIGLLLIVLCLVLSVCFNVYVVCANASIRHVMKDYSSLADRARANDMFVKRLVMDMRSLAEDHEAVRGLLVKYGMAAPSPDQQPPWGPGSQKPDPSPETKLGTDPDRPLETP